MDVSFNNFAFHKLGTIKGLDYENIEIAATSLNTKIKNDQFYANVNCMEYTFDFVINNLIFLIEKKDLENLSLMLLTLLKEMIIRLRQYDKESRYLNGKQERIVVALERLFHKAVSTDLLTVIGEIVVELVRSDHSTFQISLKIFNFLSICCNKMNNLVSLFTFILSSNVPQKGIEENVVIYMTDNITTFIREANHEHEIVDVLTYIMCAPKSEKFMENIQMCLQQFFLYRQHETLRADAESILTQIVKTAYLTPTYDWPGGESALRMAITNLPLDYEKWSDSELDLFFVFGYLQKYTLNLRTSKSLSDLLDFNEIELEWLLSNSDVRLRCRVINRWLESHSDMLINFLEKKNWVHFLLRSNVEINKFSDLLGKSSPLNGLTPDSQESDNSLVLVQAAASYISYTSNNIVSSAMFSYCLKVLSTTENEITTLKTFCHYSSTVKSTIQHCFNSDQDISAAALKLLLSLIRIQVKHDVNLPYSVTFEFNKLLLEHPYTIDLGLDLLAKIISHNKRLLINCQIDSLLGLFHLLHHLLVTTPHKVRIFRLLRKLFVCQHDMSFLIPNIHCLFDVSATSMNRTTEIYFLKYLETWLTYYAQRIYSIPLPLHLINDILLKYSPRHEVRCKRIETTLNSCAKNCIEQHSLFNQF
ncbi:hypothetical protein FQA39_LY03842 [Lamprigera yunnana]|nr:hypothetical protein FQA39_LY03842 [Lamprigera yunnana]